MEQLWYRSNSPATFLFLLCLFFIRFAAGTIYTCPQECICNYASNNIACYFNNTNNVQWEKFWTLMPTGVVSLRIEGGMQTLPAAPDGIVLPNLRLFYVHHSSLSKIESHAFHHVPYLDQLHLVHNNLTFINSSVFAPLSNLQILNVSFNRISSIHDHAFHNLHKLQTLDLSHNELADLPLSVMPALEQVQYLNLSYNNLQYVHPNTFANLNRIEVLRLHDNQLDSLHEATFANITPQETYLSNNPWACHCGIAWLIDALRSNSAYVDLDHIICASPIEYESRQVASLDITELPCQAPEFDQLPSNATISYMHTAMLQCNVTAMPPASIYWITPHGIVVHHGHQRWLPPSVSSYSSRLTFSGGPSYWEASVEALPNGSLLITNYRLYFVGLYTCVAENPNGIAVATADLSISSQISDVMEFSTILGYSAAIGFLVFSIIFGALRMCAERHCKCCRPPPPKPHVNIEDDLPPAEYYYDDYYEDYYEPPAYWIDDVGYQYDYDNTLRSPSLSPHQSPRKCVTPAEGGEFAAPHLTDDIKELLIGVRSVLRQGIGTGVERMRESSEHMREKALMLRDNMRQTGYTLRESSSNTLQRMRTSSSQYATRVRTSSSQYANRMRTSSSQYANRMRAGVAMGMEQMKSHVLSMKELCGTGDIVQTVSIVSVQTNVDNQQSIQVVRSITYV